MQNEELPVPVEVDRYTGKWSVDGLPMVLVPQHLLVNNMDAVEQRLGRDESALLFRDAGRRSAFHWCAHESARLGLSGAAIVRHYLDRLSRRGWGRFEIDTLDPSRGALSVRVRHSALLPVDGSSRSVDRACYLFEAWFEGALQYASGEPGIAPVHEDRCGVNADECRFTTDGPGRCHDKQRRP
ncbi:hypothetical protein FHS23_001275 [Prauserella isguenensis]|uniref:DUF5943 domain-containing protein n=1 Tax=Prauserella isguenensis TaxID=1470180 RepID=A0A839RZM9_9PSEU|nr:DUF5943 domain-containing protein [Prauserella isguenensis]MBB3050280.1 hypothetical protein [Prauserella isguenensis]